MGGAGRERGACESETIEWHTAGIEVKNALQKPAIAAIWMTLFVRQGFAVSVVAPVLVLAAQA